jgi:hypothetical protein
MEIPFVASSLARTSVTIALLSLLACESDNPIVPPAQTPLLAVLGNGLVTERYTAEVWVRGNVAYTTTWGGRQEIGNAIKIWDVTGVPTLVNTVIVPNASTLGDIQTSDDGQLLIVATEYSPDGSIMIYSLADPTNPQLISRYNTALTSPGVHTAEVQRVNGILYAFLSVNPGAGSPARLVIVDLSNPAVPTQVFTAIMGGPFVHDVFVRDGILITALWNQGITMWDIGGAGGGSVSNPIALGSLATEGGAAHNVWWYHSLVTGEKRYAFVGQESGGFDGFSSSGDIHVVDVSNLTSPREVAFFHIDGAGPHNFSVDETNGRLYAAYYNAGVRVIDITGDLSSCGPGDRDAKGRCDLGRMDREVAHWLDDQPVYIWGVHLAGGRLYASDMLSGIWKLSTTPLGPD